MAVTGIAALGVGGYVMWKKRRSASGRSHSKSFGITGGVKTNNAGKATTLSTPNWNNPYDMNYKKEVITWVTPKKIQLLSKVAAQNYAKQLYAAYGGSWYKNDDEQAVKAVFSKKLHDKVAVASISEAFWTLYKKDMWEYLNNFLSRSEMETHVHKPVRTLPNYRIIT